MLDPTQQSSIPLIYLTSDPHPKFTLNPKAIQLIQSHSSHSPMSFISICGDYRSGKSFLMNSLFFSKEGFKVSPTTEPCTKGINIWSKPISYNGKNIWVLDTQGFGAIDRDDSYDVKIFLLTTLISSVVMYNSFGALDENSINKLAAICLKAESFDPTISRLKMFWILRDFSLAMENKQGKPLTPDQYLSEALDDAQYKQQRLAIKKVFTQRYCIPLVRPVIDETALSQLNEIKFQQLRGEFVEQIYKLRKKMLSVTQAKYIQGVTIDGENLGMFLSKYLDMLNRNEVDMNVLATWEGVVGVEKQKQKAKIMSGLRQIVNRQMERLPIAIDQLEKLNRDLTFKTEELVREFKKHFSQQLVIKQTHQQATKYKTELFQTLCTKNSELIQGQQKAALKTIFDNLQKHLTKQFVIDAQSTQKYLERVFKTRDEYMARFQKYMEVSNGVGSHKMANNSKLQPSTSLSQLSKLMYYQQFYQQQKTLLPKLMGQFSQQIASTIIKLTQSKKLSKKHQTQLKQLKQQNHTTKQQLKQLSSKLAQAQRSFLQLQKLTELKQHQIETISLKGQNQYLQLKNEYQENIQELKETILGLEKNFIAIRKENQLERIQFEDKIKYLNERNQLAVGKIQQVKLMGEKALELVKQQYQDKLKKSEQKYVELQNVLHSQRKKFLQLNKSKKQQQSQLLQDLAEKNQKLLTLRRQIVTVEHSYKQQLQLILKQQKTSLTNEFSLQLQEKHHRLVVYEQKLEQCMIRITELEELERKYQNLLIEHRLLQEEHEVLAVKYSEVVNRLKRSGQVEQQRESLFDGVKQKLLQDIKSKDQMLNRFKLQMRNSEQEKNKLIEQTESKHNSQLASLKQHLQLTHQQTLKSKLSSLQHNYKLQVNQLLEQLKDGYSEIESLKVVRGKLQHEVKNVNEFLVKVRRKQKMMEKEVEGIMRKYKKLQKETNNQVGVDVGNNTQNPILEASSSRIQDISQLDISTIQQFSPNNKPSLTQLIQHLQLTLLPFFTHHRQHSQQLQDLKHSFKQTIHQLQHCQAHIINLNTQIHQQQSTIKQLDSQLGEFKELKHYLNQVQQKLQKAEKENFLLKNEVKVRDDIYNKRQLSIRENVQLYKQTISNLTEENQLLAEKSTKLQIQLNRFTQWQCDFSTGNPKSKTYFNSSQYLNQNQQADQCSFTHKIQSLEKENRKLKKELNHQKELSLLNTQKHPNNTLASMLLDTNHAQILQSLKKENFMYKKRVEELRERELKLIEEIKTIKMNEKQSSETKINLVKEEFQQYRKKVKQEISESEKKIEELTEQKYRLKQELLIQKQDARGYYHVGKDSLKQNTQSWASNQQHQLNKNKPLFSQTFSPDSSSNNATIQSLQQTITSLKLQNLKLHSQLHSLQTLLSKTKDDSDKKLASLQLSYEQQIRQVQSEKSRIQLQNEKNKTKYEHLLKVNNELILEVDNFKARANNQMTLKEKYKSKISTLFMDD